MKKALALVLVLAVLVSGAFAGGKKEAANDGKLTKETMKVGFVYIGAINDEGYTQAHDKGRLAIEAMGIETAYVENVGENSDCEVAIRNLIDQGCNVIYTNSFGFMDWTAKVAKDFPNLYFGHCSGYTQLDNMCSYFGKVYQARYLAGIAAGLRTANGKIGYVAAMQLPEVIRGINAFTLGVLSVNPTATVEVIWTNTWYDPSVEKQAALELLNKGCDVLEQHQDTTAPQIAAQEKGAYCIGYNVATPTAAPKSYLTAPIFNWDVFYTQNVQKILDGTWKGVAYWEDMSTGVVGLDALTANCAPGTAEAIEPVKQAMINHEFDPFCGPIYDQNGVERVPAGVQMTDDEIWNMSWFVKGVIGKAE
ncbi:MAG: BMP family ABC transporter substrate-binding protein [Treponema sp.]|nr:BMP family ABC transporter substrate-binding protein [Candidatus Treponema caballi]